MNQELIEKVESIKATMVARATGGEADDDFYRMARSELMALPHIASKLPQAVRVCRNVSDFWGFIKSKFPTYAERREYLRTEFEPLLATLESEHRSPSDALISAAIKTASLGYIQEAWHKALERRATDPEGAITAARTLLESVCKHVLDNEGIAYDDGADLPKLYTQTVKHLNLSPSQHTEQLFKQILGGCQSVVEGLGALRNRHSDAHGKGIAGTKPAPRHAELAVNLAGATATFLLQTWEARSQ
jgi:hypothetical protein